MSRFRSVAFCLAALLFFLSGSVSTDAQSADALAGRLASIVREADLGDGVGVHVVDIATGREIYGRAEDTVRNPASNMKLVTAAAALLRLGPDHRMLTALYGRVVDGRVQTLVLRGTGDPTTRMSDLVELAERLQDRGVRAVANVVVDGHYFDDQVLPPAFDQQPNETAAFRAPISAVSVERNSYAITVLPNATAGQPARVRLAAAGHFDLNNGITTGEPGSNPRVIAVQRAGDDTQMRLRVRGSVPAGGPPSSFRRRIEQPLSHAGHAMAEALARAGIRGARRVSIGTLPHGLPMLASRRSPTLSRLLHRVGKNSDNFVAEMVLKVIAAEHREPGSSQHGTEILQEVLGEAGVPTGAATIVNGSGLFQGNQIAPSHLTRLLRYVYRNPAVRSEYLAQLAVGGVDGTLHRRMRRVPAGTVRAKTGTLNDVISLSGYVLSADGGQAIAFSVLINGARGRQHPSRQMADAIAGAIASHLNPPS